MHAFIQILKTMITDVLTALYLPFFNAVLIAFLAMFVYLYAKEHHWHKHNVVKNVLRTWASAFKKESQFRKAFLFFFIVALILLRTLLNRPIWSNPLGYLFGGWTFTNENGLYSTECVENVILFIPYTLAMFYCFEKEFFGKIHTFKQVMQKSLKVSFLSSLFIESMQTLFFLGTFQFSDLTYNTLGGLIGGILFYIIHRLRH